MSNPYVGEIRMFAGNFAPNGWALCQGQSLQISQYDALFNLIGTTYGGDGISTFNLPDLRSRIPIHMGTQAGISYTLGEAGGTESVALTVNQIPAHTHTPMASAAGGTSNSPAGNVWADWTGSQYSDQGVVGPSQMNPAALAPAGAGMPHANMLPYLAVNFIISLSGIFPSPA